MLPLPCMLVCCFCLRKIARGTAGAASTRSSLRPLISKRANEMQTSGAMRREIAKLYPRHCERSEAIHGAAGGEMDCFATLATTGEGSGLRPLPLKEPAAAVPKAGHRHGRHPLGTGVPT